MTKAITTIIGGAIWGFIAYTIASAIGFEPGLRQLYQPSGDHVLAFEPLNLHRSQMSPANTW